MLKLSKKAVYGKQQGVSVGCNPYKCGAASYHLLLAFCAETQIFFGIYECNFDKRADKTNEELRPKFRSKHTKRYQQSSITICEGASDRKLTFKTRSN